jgi:hypothetical protein
MISPEIVAVVTEMISRVEQEERETSCRQMRE